MRLAVWFRRVSWVGGRGGSAMLTGRTRAAWCADGFALYRA